MMLNENGYFRVCGRCIPRAVILRFFFVHHVHWLCCSLFFFFSRVRLNVNSWIFLAIVFAFHHNFKLTSHTYIFRNHCNLNKQTNELNCKVRANQRKSHSRPFCTLHTHSFQKMLLIKPFVLIIMQWCCRVNVIIGNYITSAATTPTPTTICVERLKLITLYNPSSHLQSVL